MFRVIGRHNVHSLIIVLPIVGGDLDAIIVAGDVQLVRFVGQSLRFHLDGRLQQNFQVGKKVFLSNYVRRLTSKKIQSAEM